MTKKHNPKPPYPAEFRQQRVELVEAGRKPVELACEFGCHETSITAWVRAAKVGSAAPGNNHAPLSNAERQALIELRRKPE